MRYKTKQNKFKCINLYQIQSKPKNEGEKKKKQI